MKIRIFFRVFSTWIFGNDIHVAKNGKKMRIFIQIKMPSYTNESASIKLLFRDILYKNVNILKIFVTLEMANN